MVILSAVIYIFNKSIINLIVIIGAVYIAFTFTLSIINSSYKARSSSGLLISTLPDDVLRLSKEKNIIYIVLDRFDTSFFAEILEGQDSELYTDKMFKDFTFFNNYSSAHTTTPFSGSATIAGKPYDNSKPWKQFRQEAFTSGNSLFEILQKDGWDNILYHEHRHTDSVYAPNYELYSNSSSGAYDKAPKGTERKYLYASVYRIVPDFLKNKMKILNATTGSDIMKILNATTGSDIWDFKFLNMVKNNNIKINNNNVFSLIHLAGPHMPPIIDENFNNIGKKGTYVQQSKASLKLVNIYLEKLKAANTKLYDNSLIIISSDHGGDRFNALLLIKEINAHSNKMVIDSRPFSQIYLKDMILELLQGKSIPNLKEHQNRKGYDYMTVQILDSGYNTPIFEYRIPDKMDYKDHTYNSYNLLSILTPDKSYITDKKIELDFPKDYNKMPNGLLISKNWKNTEKGLRCPGLIYLMFDNMTKQVDIAMEVLHNNDDSNRFSFTTFNIDKGKVLGSIKIGDKNYIKKTIDVNKTLLLRCNKDNIILKKFILNIRLDINN
ncbi:MAG: sulfatase-like hydrolase/transferase [Mucispirillum sp.]|nr:sulfatase-like hydrolase/transferase [Mucispirillum sp.]